jgi:protein-glucosylgalactosylhydroxylysine glucosidase
VLERHRLALRHLRSTPGETDPACDGSLLWESAGALSTCGVAYVTELIGDNTAEPERPPLMNCTLTTGYTLRVHGRHRYRLRQMTSVVLSAMHSQPDFEAVR